MTDDQGSEFQADCNYDDPTSVVCAFIAAMNKWEISCADASKSAKASGNQSDWKWVLGTMNDVFGIYCTFKPRPHGRQGSFQRPPEYDPEKEKIISSSIDGQRSMVDTTREAVLGGGNYRYTLLRQAGQWRIDNVKFDEGESWRNAIL